jgi:CRP/FNR family transcriptional regulator
MSVNGAAQNADLKTAALRRLQEFISLDDQELSALENAVSCQRVYRRREPILRQGDRVTHVYLLIDGWVGSHTEVDGGSNQLSKVHLPGDIAGLPNIALVEAASSLIPLTVATVGLIPLKNLARLFETAPRLALTLFVNAQQERVMLMDHLAAVGQTDATQRVCALLMHFHRRLKLLRPDHRDLIDWPLSQEHMAQGAGLTSVHVNRTLRELTRKGLIERVGKSIRLLDVDAVSELAAFPDRRFVHEPSWLTSMERSHGRRVAAVSK